MSSLPLLECFCNYNESHKGKVALLAENSIRVHLTFLSCGLYTSWICTISEFQRGEGRMAWILTLRVKKKHCSE